MESFATWDGFPVEALGFFTAADADFREDCLMAGFGLLFALDAATLAALAGDAAELAPLLGFDGPLAGLLFTVLPASRLAGGFWVDFADVFLLALAGFGFSTLLALPGFPAVFGALVGDAECFFALDFGFPPLRAGAAAAVVAIFFTGFVARPGIR